MLRVFSALILSLSLFLPAGVLADAGLPDPWPARIAETSTVSDPGHRAELLSRPFLGVPYQAGTLGGGAGRPEELTINVAAVDCFTLLDYVEAMRRSKHPEEFRIKLTEVRYRDDIVSWETRRHFFTDWGGTSWLRDVTAVIGGRLVRTTTKALNLKDDGRKFLPGVAVQQRAIAWLPQSALDAAILSELRNGDYLGIYSERNGLDVSHVGLVVRQGGRLDFRHASNQDGVMQVVDTPLPAYLADKPGIVLLRPVTP